jgi:putative NADPH-quinone reductase
MEVLVILGHPYTKSFNGAIYQTVIDRLGENGHEVYAHDLYDEQFNPILQGSELLNGETDDPLVLEYRYQIKKVQGLIIIHPNWWGQPPAILKGWTDRVLRSGIAYDFDDGDDGSGVPKGLLKIDAAIIFNTSNTPSEREMRVFGDPLERIWGDCVLDFCGVKNYYRKIFRVMASSSLEERQKWLEEVKSTIDDYFP